MMEEDYTVSFTISANVGEGGVIYRGATGDPVATDLVALRPGDTAGFGNVSTYTLGLNEVYVDIEALPAPLRPVAYLSSPWRLTSEWYEWPLER